MKIDLHTVFGICVFSPQGRLDAASTPQLRKCIHEKNFPDTDIVVDLSGVDFLDSNGLGALVAGARWLRQHNGDLKLAAPVDNVRRVFNLTRADRLFDIFDDPIMAALSYGRM